MKKGSAFMWTILLYVICSAGGLVLLKLGVTKNMEVSLAKEGIRISFSWLLMVGFVLYLLAFLIGLIAMKRIELSIFYPISASLVFVLVCVLSHFVLEDKIDKMQMIGMICIFIGVIFMNIKK